MITRFLLCIILITFPSKVLAAAGWSTLGTVSQVYSHNGNHVVLTSISNNPCGIPGKFWWPTDDPDAKDMFTLSLSAFMSEKQVRVVFDGDAPNCNYNGALATHMMIGN
jgi:hypothetical protein